MDSTAIARVEFAFVSKTGALASLARVGASSAIQQKTGLIPDAYFSGPKIKWLSLRVRKLPMEAAFLCPVSKGNRTFP